ncbi:hypothetical protein LX16_0685 [Stackebrandtia albiflava]|uniref:Uncharacterized protein n=1 Tax=Stackebrandtia albiflava TaxID=406432 RepID=A0A562VAS8_9ACTN|nr:hypothetical protein [Stackebrandtia albiflava]TWJ14990.1 hypothetical protein LX16_0685 [Stackebrandtia albiflava]
MNNEDLDVALREALHRQAGYAPVPHGLAETVRYRSRRRAIRDRIAVACLAAVLVCGAAVGVGVTMRPEPSVAAAFGSDEVAVCVALTDGRVTTVTLTERRDGDTVDTEQSDSTDGTVALRHTARGGEFPVTVEVVPLRTVETAWERGEPTTVGTRTARLTTTDSGALLLMTDLDIAGLVIVVETGEPAPTEARLLAWVESFSVHTDPAACA